jgi:hypothetical protein
MRENKLYFQGEEIYLKTCNYLVSAYLNDKNNLVVCPHYKYFNSEWETNAETAYPNNQTDATNQIRAHFKVIKDMGFNSVRIMNCQVRTRWDSDILTTRLFIRNYQTELNPDPERENSAYGIRNYEILTDLVGENGKEYYLQIMQIVLSVAAEYDLKVIWVLGGEWDYVDENNVTHHRSLLTSQNTPIFNQFKDFVEDVAQEFKSNTALIGYDLFYELKTFNNNESSINYYDLSNSVKEIVKAIKTVDINHFITVGFISINNFYTLGVKPFYHTDIYSFHLYEGEYEYHDIPLGGEINRQLKYFSTLEHPWMIAETGYSTYNEDVDNHNQRNYIASTGYQNFNCNSLGYSWWELYDMDYGTNRWGLLRRTAAGETVILDDTNIKIYGDYKYSVDPSFTNNLNNSIFHLIETTNNGCNFPMDSYYHFFPTVNGQELKTWDGYVSDGNNAIENAIVKIGVMYDDPGSENPNDLKLYDFFAFTNSAGYFSMTIPTNDYLATISVTKYGYNINTTNNVLNSDNPLHINDNIYTLTHQSLPSKLQPTYSIEVNSGQTTTLDKPTMITGNIYVYGGGTLKISSIICFDDNSQLKIFPGGKVILEDKAVLTAKHEYWLGIVMMNFNNLTYFPDSYLSSTGNTIIANAFQGISSHYDNHIYLQGTNFINNYSDVYIHLNNTEVVFKNCNFILDENALEQYSISESCDNHVKIDWSSAVKFINCHFEDRRDFGNPPNKTGIYAYNVDTISVLPDPYMGAKRSTFINLHYGIKAISDAQSDIIIVKNCDFTTVRGIYLLNYMGFSPNTIINNIFNIKNYYFPIIADSTKLPIVDPVPPEDEFLYRPYGIYIDNITDKYQIEGNTFKSESGNQSDIFGIIVNNNGSIAKSIYRNKFVNLENAVQSINRNRNTADGSNVGLQILCNDFYNTKTDIYVTSEFLYSNWGIAGYQGSLSRPSANLFSSITPQDYYTINNELVPITFFIRSDTDPYYNPRELPNSVSENIYVYPMYFGISDACPDYTNKLPTPIDEELIRIEMSTAKILETAITSMLNDIVDGGNTGQTISSVLHADDNKAWLIYYDLIGKSPYLSDTVLKEVSKKEQGLTAPMIRDILVANPQGIKNKDLQQMLKDRDNPLPDYMIEQIEAGFGIISAKENLELQRAEQQLIYEENLKTLVEFYISISDFKPWAEDSIYSLLDGSKEPRFMYLLADYYFSKYDYTKAKTELDRIIQFCELSEDEIRENRDLFDFYNLYANLMKIYRYNLSNITNPLHINELKAFEIKGGLAGVKARAILMYNNATDYREPVYTPTIPIENRNVKHSGVNSNNPYFSVYPNPAKEYFYLEYSLPEVIGTMQVVISDITGKFLMQKQIYEPRDIIIIKTVDLLPGTYNCTLYSGNKSAYNGKIIVE